jgi:hypothetical protein
MALCALFVLGAARITRAAETDQFLVWDRELADSAPALNAYLNETIEAFLDQANTRSRPYRSREDLTEALFKHLFAGLHASRVRNWVNTSPDVDRYPPGDTSIWQYQRMSLYRDLSFPFVLPMGRTVRVGDVYFGSDKIGHVLGFGRRYLQRYLRHRNRGAFHEEAVEKIVSWGLTNELSFVGGLVDGIASHADLEANYQGFRLALDCCRGPAPYLDQREGRWVLTRPVDLRDYITPDFDESYNPCHYLGQRWNHVAPQLERRYHEIQTNPRVQARFARYAARGHSVSRMLIEQHYANKKTNTRISRSLRPPDVRPMEDFKCPEASPSSAPHETAANMATKPCAPSSPAAGRSTP